MSQKPALVLVGGFLGSGKTSLILAAARMLEKQGLRAAAILNDQGDDLVDTRLTQERGVPADQVTGGCFCCRFSDLLEAAERLEAYEPDVIFAEAVGSCTDLAATVLRPLLTEYAGRFRVAPLTVLLDPVRAHEPARPGYGVSVYLNQIAEADIICCSKADLGVDAQPRDCASSVREPARAWRSGSMKCSVASYSAGSPGNVEIDYARYAQAEAALAWMNCRLSCGRGRRSPPRCWWGR